MGLNRIIENRVGFGSFQIKSLLILCLIDMYDGIEVILNSFLNPIIKKIYGGSTTSYIALLASAFFIGNLFGSLASGYLADKHGRRTIIRCGAFLQVISAAAFCFASSLLQLFMIRLFYGFSFGFTIAITSSLFAEITPVKYRAKGILMIVSSTALGKLFAIGLGHIFLKSNLQDTNWKMMVLCGSIPNLIVIVGCQLVLKQSARFLLSVNKFDESFDVLNVMIRTNKGEYETQLTPLEQQQLRNQFYFTQLSQTQEHHNYSVLFNQQNIKKIIFLSLSWIIINFCYFGQLTMAAFHISDSNVTPKEGLSKYFSIILGEMPTFLLSLFIIDNPYFGRKISLSAFFAAAAIFSMLFALFKLTFMASASLFFMKNIFQIIYPLTTESFQTKIRTKGFGFCCGIGRLGSILMSFVLIPLDEWNQSSVYVCFFILLSIVSCTTFLGVEETLNKSLDVVNFSTKDHEEII